MARIIGSLKMSSNMEVRAGAPLDARSIVPTKADLTLAANFPYDYIGMAVVVQEEAKMYILKARPTTDIENWVEGGSAGDLDNYYTKSEVDEIVARVYKPAGSATLATLPDLTEDPLTTLGNVYNMTEEFTTTDDFAEGAGNTYPVGTNVVVVNLGDDTTPNYKFDVLPGFIDLSGYQLKIQMDVMPAASEDEEGNIYQYTGATTANYTNGYFYQCIEDPETPDTYIWVEKSVSDASSSGELSDTLTCTKSAGGINVGDTYAAGTTFETLWRDLLNPTAYPTLTAPSVTLTTATSKLLESGATVEATLTANFSRGSISPAYGTDGYRSGAATGYALNGGTPQAGNTFPVTVDSTNKSFTVNVSYEAGEQPKDSTGADYDSPLPAGSVNSATLVFEFVDALWANIASITQVAKQALVSKTTGLKAFTFPAATAANPEIFDVPASWTVTAVEVLNTLSNIWEDCSSEFTITDTTHNDASDTAVNYKRYTCNLGYAMDSRQIRIKWS